MKITNITQQDNIYEVTKEPNIIEKIFGFKTRIDKYKYIGRTYQSIPSIRVYVNQNGKILGPVHRMTDALENWRRRF
jgi:hypothetical protein